MDVRRPQLAELGLFLLFVALPLVVTPFTTSPFGDPKLVVLVGGTLALWGAGVPLDRRLAILAGVWVAVTAVAGLAAVDPWRGLTASTEATGGGLMLTLCCGVLVALAPGLPLDLRERGRRWFVATAAAVGVIGLASRLFPDLATRVLDAPLVGATMGNQLFAAALVAAGIGAAAGGFDGAADGGPGRRLGRQLALLALLSFSAASFGERTSLVLPLVATAAALWRARVPVRRAAVIGAVVVGSLVLWQPIEPLLHDTGVGAAVTGIEVQATDQHRLIVWRAVARGFADRPLLGWGPGSTRSAYVANATAQDLETATRRWGDAHDLFLETGVTTGVVGLAALLALLFVLTIRALRSPPGNAWAVGAAAALGAYALVEPLSLVLTPLLFMFGGLAASAPNVSAAQRPPAAFRLVTGALLGVSLVVALMMGIAATLERWGNTYSEVWALRAAVTVQPWRLSAVQRLAIRLALDGRSGDEAAATDARETIAAGVERHPWDAEVRLWAADVETLLRNPEGARRWVELHLERFPAERAGLEEATETGSEGGLAP